jgi:pantothenate synthetase
VILAAARLGKARLIDNILLESQEQLRNTGT